MSLESRTVDYLSQLSYMNDLDSRRAFLYVTFGGDTIQRMIIDYTGASQIFCAKLVGQLSQYGTLEDGRSALEAVLQATRDDVGVDRQRTCDELIEEWRKRRPIALTDSKAGADSGRGEARKIPWEYNVRGGSGAKLLLLFLLFALALMIILFALWNFFSL